MHAHTCTNAHGHTGTRLVCTEKACTRAHKAPCMHACTRTGPFACAHTEQCTFAHISTTMHACMHAHQPTCMQVCTHRTQARVYTRHPASLHTHVHTHTQVLVGLCLYSNPRRPAELRGRRREGREEERRARGELGESLSSWLVGHLGGPSLVAVHSKPKPPYSSDCSHPVSLSYPDLSPLS